METKHGRRESKDDARHASSTRENPTIRTPFSAKTLDCGQEPIAPLGNHYQLDAVPGTECLNNLKVVSEFG